MDITHSERPRATCWALRRWVCLVARHRVICGLCTLLGRLDGWGFCGVMEIVRVFGGFGLLMDGKEAVVWG